jgi:hypothetical protein
MQSGNGDNPTDDVLRSSQCFENVRLARAATNASIKVFYRSGVLHPTLCDVASRLVRVRNLVDEEPIEGQDEKMIQDMYQSVHNVVKEFGSLISSVIRVYVVDTIVPMLRVDDSEHKYEVETISLLKLLLSFVELKESMGIERATLTGIMAVGKSNSEEYQAQDDGELNEPGLPFIVNDVVMVVENQHRILLELEKQSGVHILKPRNDTELDDQVESTETSLDPNLLRLVGESIKQSDEMKNLQDHIRKEFDMNRFQHVSQRSTCRYHTLAST